ncbi:MAG: single-stranded DNA-binding protein [Planctomycetota bacterium]
MSLIEITDSLADAMVGLRFSPPVAHVYHPLRYAWDVHRSYLERFAHGPKEALWVGMNPGPFGMVQTGVPFGEVEAVRSWLGLRGRVESPPDCHPRRPVLGFDCPRSEVSGRRLWRWAARRFVTPQRFFRRFYVHNYCPLAFTTDTGANLTPDKLRKADARSLFDLCDRLLSATVEALRPRLVIGIGAFAHRRAAEVLQGRGISIGRIPHPSPASPAANRGWEALAESALSGLGVSLRE